jgi:hypothetical protein
MSANLSPGTSVGTPAAAAVDVMNVLNKLLSTVSQMHKDNAAKLDTAKADTKSSKRG